MKNLLVLLTAALLFLALCCPAGAEAPGADLDLSAMPASVAYAQAVHLLREPEAYAGQTLRVGGIFNYSQARGCGVVIVTDRAGCCEAGLDFVPAEALVFPEDYPALYARIVVTGIFTVSGDGSCLLTGAVIEPA